MTGAELLEAFEDHLNVGDTDAGTDPKQSSLISYLNKAMRKIAYKLEPDELKSEGISVATVAGTNTATHPTTLLKIRDLFSKDAGDYKRLFRKPVSISTNPQDIFSTSSSYGSPSYFEIRNSKIIVDKSFVSSNSDGLKAYGILVPTSLDADDLTPDINLGDDYEDAVLYQAAIYYYARDFDSKNLGINRDLLREELAHLRTFVSNITNSSISLDPRFWNHRRI